MSDWNETSRALANITDTGLFEQLVTDVLRLSKPESYGFLTHPGINSDGKPVKSPVDGFAYIPGSNPPHLVSAQHTTSAEKELENKWLYNPDNVKSKKRNKNSQRPGDVFKFLKDVKEERQKKNLNIKATLALTSNREPSRKLISKISEIETDNNVTIDIWSRSRLVHHLDNNPDGQWIRQRYFGNLQQRLSKGLLQELSQKSLELYPQIKKEKGAIIPRAWQHNLSDISPQTVLFIIGESGFGKSTSCHYQLLSHLESGGAGLILTHQAIENNYAIENAISYELEKLHSGPLLNSGINAIKLCSAELPLLLIIEDVNQAENRDLIINRLFIWASNDKEKPCQWRILCPIQPKIYYSIGLEAKKYIDTSSLWIKIFTPDEARKAIISRASVEKIDLMPFEVDHLAEDLGYDPFLISLYDFHNKPRPHKIIDEFINSTLQIIGNQSNHLYTNSDLLSILQKMSQKMLEQKKITPAWNEVKQWFNDQHEFLKILSLIVKNGKIIRLTSPSNGEKLEFRHDRICTWVFSKTIHNLIISSSISDIILSEPFFAEIIGASLVEDDIPEELLQNIRILNPLALFYAYKISQGLNKKIFNSITDLLNTKEFQDPKNHSLRIEALGILGNIESSKVIEIIEKFPEKSWSLALGAGFINGNLIPGLQICLNSIPTIKDNWRDHLIDQVKARFRNRIFDTLSNFLRKKNSSGLERVGALYLAGHLGDSSLIDSITDCWQLDPENKNHLFSYLWAATKCANKKICELSFLEPFFNAWANLSDQKVEENKLSERENIGALMRSAFHNETTLSSEVLLYYIRQSECQELYWHIVNFLSGINQTEAIEFTARQSANFYAKNKNNTFSIHTCSYWEGQFFRGQAISLLARQRLQELFEDINNDINLRRQAFYLWRTASTKNDLKYLQRLTHILPLENEILAIRVKHGDKTVLSELWDKVTNQSANWLNLARHLPAEDLVSLIEKILHARSFLTFKWGEKHEYDQITSELLMYIKLEDAENIIVKHWSHLQYNAYFIMTAIYLATQKMCNLANTTFEKYPNKNDIFVNITNHFGINFGGHPGVQRMEQIKALIPYLSYLKQKDIFQFWNLCNKFNWIDLRKKYLDSLLSGEWRTASLIDESDVFYQWDQISTRNKNLHMQTELWIKRYLELGNTISLFFDLLNKWYKKNQSLPRLQFVSTAIILFGTRPHLKILLTDRNLSDTSEKIIENTQFVVFRRTLI